MAARLRPLFLALFALLVVLPTGRAAAQGAPGTPVLPDIAPREVEIRGELEIQFPSLQRQPLIGFNPPPRVIEIPANRRPYVGPYKQEQADLPPSPLVQPRPPSVSPLAGQTPVDGEFGAGLGRYFSRFAYARGGVPLGAGGAAYGRFVYEGSDGHTPDLAFDEQRSAADVFEGAAGVSSTGQTFRGGVEADGFSQDFRLFGARLGPPIVRALAADSLPERYMRGGGVSAWFAAGDPARAAVEGRVRLGGARVETDRLLDGDDTPAAEALRAGALQTERRVDADIQAEMPFGPGALLLGASGGAATRDVFGDEEGTGAWVDALAALRFLHAGRIDITAGARFLALRADDTGEERWGWLAPVVRFETYPSPRLRLYAENRPGVEPNSLADVFRLNPYLVDEPFLRPTLRTIDAEAGVSFFTGPVQIAARAGYGRAPNHLYFTEAEAETPDYETGFFVARYDAADVARIGGDVSVVLPAGFHATAGATLRRGRLRDQDADLPYFAPLVGQAMLSYAFDESRGLVQLVGQFESARPRTAAADAPETDAYVDLDLRGTYAVSESIGLLVRLENLGGAERWYGYPRPPAVLAGGVRVRW